MKNERKNKKRKRNAIKIHILHTLANERTTLCCGYKLLIEYTNLQYVPVKREKKNKKKKMR